MSESYILYGSYASYYTAKVRGLLRKKGIPFVEQLPSHPRFREVVRPGSGTHRIPQLETPSGEVLQDSVAIMDHLDAAHPELPALPETPVQRLAVHLMELFGSEGLVRLAWQYRWLFPGNEFFVKMDFGRSFKPQGSDDELMHYGNLIADRMLSRGQLASDDGVRAALEAEYVALLQKLEAHFTEHPYLLGGHPSNADYALMGALHAHMGRDPVPLSVMQNHAPRVFRWMEHMLVPEVQSPEFHDRPIIYPADDALPETFTAVLSHLADRYADAFELNARAWAALAMKHQNEAAGLALSEAGDQPGLSTEIEDENGSPVSVTCNLYHAWVGQRAQRHFAATQDAARDACATFAEDTGTTAFLTAVPLRWLERAENRLVLGA